MDLNNPNPQGNRLRNQNPQGKRSTKVRQVYRTWIGLLECLARQGKQVLERE
ncbi:hypothetical protein C1H46_044378 [Malus baccata]|uniref:Uncharacterized protein n=1 Tax=Malus baccata TaxID=106549 RepID=A0A540K799_MALBA|nr:hypothetical protein C1H46_044378 [Malus baccata]